MLYVHLKNNYQNFIFLAYTICNLKYIFINLLYFYNLNNLQVN